jgi:hypothetical protein
MSKIRDLGINFIPETAQPEENDAGGAFAMAAKKKPPCGTKSAKPCPPPTQCPAGTTVKTIPPKKKAGELTHEAIESLQAQLQQRMADAAQAGASPTDLTS